MAGITMNRKRQLVAAFLLSLLGVSTAWSQTPGPQQSVGRMIGNIDGISFDGDQSFIFGWACQLGLKNVIAVYVDKGVPLTNGMANLFSEPAVQNACQDHDGGNHRFFIVLPFDFDRTKTLQAEGFIPGHPERGRLGGSGTHLAHFPGLNAPFGPPPPPLRGAYHRLAEHPRVFVTASELKDFAVRINRPGSYSSERFIHLAGNVVNALTTGINWDATYSGCLIDIYMYVFSIEPPSPSGLDEKIRATLKLDSNSKPPAGPAVVASQLALYAALVKAGAIPPKGYPSADQAVGLAKRILLA